ncbi:zinc finger CCCH domain-containing protein 15-like [Cornus florida]|uniref:zinc finger CCCH domain-containing protein 15-like n=1 Tax=Cornus florida TaxID=4283 RepID=UPI0028A29742|nr:zinc finger CCCH domain-containing protein 15-like [Cornus florida]
MQREISTSNGGIIDFDQSDGFDGYTSLYSSVFQPQTSFFSLTPSDCSTDEDTGNSPIGVDFMQSLENASYSRFLLEHQDLVDRHNLCLSHLRNAAKEAEALRQDNMNLRVSNINLNKRLALLIRASVNNRSDHYTSSSASSFVNDQFRQMCIGETAAAAAGNESGAWEEVSVESPTSVIENDRFEGKVSDRVSLPKSISVRPNDQAGGSNGGRVRRPNRIKTPHPFTGTQKVYVRGGGNRKEEQQQVELEVYNQGMFKTELCNKWQETGACPYGEQCQFAHGIAELRPVLRHPRYKTEVCRMVLAGDHCPYGHRCHFRHALTDEERLSLRRSPLKPKPVNMQ